MSIKSLAGQTMWYGVSSILGRFINLLVTPIIAILGTNVQGEYGTVYANIAFLNILFTYGMETTYFRFSRDEDEKKIFNIASSSILLTTVPLIVLMILFRKQLGILWSIPTQIHIVLITIFIILFDTIATIPFARLRFQQRPRKFAFIKIINILINVFLVFFFIILCPKLQKIPSLQGMMKWYDFDLGITYAFIANLIASGVTLLFLVREFTPFQFSVEKGIWKKMMMYSLPLLIVGLGGMINETFDRIALTKLLKGSSDYAKTQTGIYVVNYKLAALIIIFIQAFRMGAEPFFIKQSLESDAPRTYARILNFFVIFCCFGFLSVVLFYDVWKYYIRADIFPERLEGFKVVPVLLFAKILYGIYYNLTVWFKLENKTHYGAIITVIGAAITLFINIIFVPRYSYMACAWAAVACYLFMVFASYYLGKKFYPVPYNFPKAILYMAVAYIIYLIYLYSETYIPSKGLKLIYSSFLILLFAFFALWRDRKEFSSLPIIGKYLK